MAMLASPPGSEVGRAKKSSIKPRTNKGPCREAAADCTTEPSGLPGWLQSRDVSSVGRHDLVITPDPSSVSQPLMTIPEVAEHLRVSTRTVRRMTRSGELEAVKIRRSVRVPATAVEELTNGKSAMKTGNRIVS